MDYVDVTDSCWNWCGGTNHFGHGKYRRNGRLENAHRVSWEMHTGSIPTGMFVLHKCDNPKCVNPEHLFLGTAWDNTQDMLKKGRHHIGLQAKITQEIADEIRRKYQEGVHEKELSEEYGLSRTQTHRIVTNQCWISNSNTNSK